MSMQAPYVHSGVIWVLERRVFGSVGTVLLGVALVSLSAATWEASSDLVCRRTPADWDALLRVQPGTCATASAEIMSDPISLLLHDRLLRQD